MAGSAEWSQTEFLVVDQFPFLALLDPFDRQPHLLFELVVRTVVQVRHARMDADHGLHGRAENTRGGRGVIDKRFGDLDVLGKAGHQVDVPFTVAIDGERNFNVLVDRFLKSRVRGWEVPAAPVSRSLRDRVKSTQGVIVRTVTSEGLSETRSVSPKNSPSVSSAIRRLLPCTPLLRTSTCPWAMMKNLLRSSPSTISLLPSETIFGLEPVGHPSGKASPAASRTAAHCAATPAETRTAPSVVPLQSVRPWQVPPWSD